MKRPLIDRLNRWLFVVLGIVFVVAGVGALLLSYRVFGRARSRLPVIDANTSAVIDRTDWFWPVLAGAGLVLAGLSAWWLISQLRVQRLTRLTLADSGAGATYLAASALTDAVRDESLALPGVGRARARLVRDQVRPDLHLTVWLVEPYDLAETLTTLEGTVLPRAAHALGTRQLRSFIEMQVAGGSSAKRVR